MARLFRSHLAKLNMLRSRRSDVFNMKVILFILLTIQGVFAHATDARPIGRNCNLASPPRNSGEEINHGITLKIFPRAKNIDSTYTGCQTMWMPEGPKWLVVSMTIIERGDAIRIWSPDKDAPEIVELFSCTYKYGKVVNGNAEKCADSRGLIKKSLTPECIVRIAKASGEFPADCKYE